MRRFAGLLILVLAVGFAAGCPRGQAPAPEAKKPAGLQGLPVEVTVKQRSTTPLPGSGDAVRLTVDDITRGQVMLSLTDSTGGAVLLGRTSLAPGASAAFKHGESAYRVTLKSLSNALIGEDFATVTVAADAGALTESAKIERLLEHIASMEGAVFIRNGGEHTAADAASHLRMKWNSADPGGRLTARQFIEQIASRSSLSDDSYQIRLRDGTEVAAGEYLQRQLAAMK